MNKLILKVSALAITMIALMPFTVLADGPGFGGGVDDGGACVPLDGGLSMLIAAGVGYGVKKYRDTKKTATTEK